MTEKLIVCFQSKKVKICKKYIFLQLFNIFEEILSKNVTNDFSIFWRTAALKVL